MITQLSIELLESLITWFDYANELGVQATLISIDEKVALEVFNETRVCPYYWVSFSLPTTGVSVFAYRQSRGGIGFVARVGAEYISKDLLETKELIKREFALKQHPRTTKIINKRRR